MKAYWNARRPKRCNDQLPAIRTYLPVASARRFPDLTPRKQDRIGLTVYFLRTLHAQLAQFLVKPPHRRRQLIETTRQDILSQFVGQGDVVDRKESKNLVTVVHIPVLLVVCRHSAGCKVGQDKEAAENAASRIHTQMRKRDFAGIYNQSASGFKTVTEEQFVSQMNEIYNKLGQISEVMEVAYQTGLDTRAGRTHTLIFAVRCDLGTVRETLVLVRANTVEMQLWKLGLSQSNERP